MKHIRSAKQLTFLYFSVVAFAIIAIHASVFEMTTEDIEYLYAHNKLKKISTYAQQYMATQNVSGRKSMEIQTQGTTDFDPKAKIYFDGAGLPKEFPQWEQIPYGKSIEIGYEQQVKTFFAMKENMFINGVSKDVLFVIDNSLYEFSEEQLFSNQTKPIVISLSLLFISLFVVLKISERLTQPISGFANTLATKSPDDLNPIPLPSGTYTQELLKMIETFNIYQSRIHSLLERERSFNRYISHELRSPLMVMSGAITLLAESDDPKFIERQRQRLKKSTKEMEEFIDTLLSLSKSIQEIDLSARRLEEQELLQIVKSHEHLLCNKAIIWEVFVNSSPLIQMPEAALHILLGNLIKNAFLFTEQGKIEIIVDQYGIQVIDTGMGLSHNTQSPHGFGLGLLLVKDICHRYGWSFSLKNNHTQGCTARIRFCHKA